MSSGRRERVARAYAALAPDLRRGVRAAIVTVVPFFLAHQLARPELAWTALGGWLASIADPGGTARLRTPAMAAFLLIGAAAVAAGTAISRWPVGAAALFGATAFAASIARAAGGSAGSMGTVVAIVVAVASTSAAPPLPAAAWFSVGVLAAIAMSSIVWPTWPHLPLRHAVARVYDALADYVEAIDELVGAGAREPGAWAAMARHGQRPVRGAIEAARDMMVELRARRSGVTPVGANTRALLGEAESEFFRLIGYADELEARVEDRDVGDDRAVLAELAGSHRAIRDQLFTRRAGTWRPRAPVTRVSPLAQGLIADSRAAVELSRDLDVSPATTVAEVGSPRRAPEAVRAIRDALTWRSPIVLHAVRVAATAIAATLIGRAVSPHHAQWVSITAIAVQQPYLGSTLIRVAERVLGTAIGGAVAIALIATLDTPLATALAMFPLLILAMVTRPRSYRLFVVFLTPAFVLVADRWHPDLATALERLLDVAIGGGLAVAAGAIAPSWERARLPDAVTAALAALDAYVELAFDVLEQGGDRTRLIGARRAVGVALESAEASLERMLAEPRVVRRGTASSVFLLTFARRLSAALTALDERRAARGEAAPLPPSPEARAYVHAVLAAASRYVSHGERAALVAPVEVAPALARVVHCAALLDEVERAAAASA